MTEMTSLPDPSLLLKPARPGGHHRLRRVRAALPPARHGDQPHMVRRQGRRPGKGEIRPRAGRRRDHHVDRGGAQRAGEGGASPLKSCARSGWVLNRTPTRSSPAGRWSRKRSEYHPRTAQRIRNSPARPARKPSSWAWGWWGPEWESTRSPSEWIPPRESPVTSWNSPPLPAGQLSSSDLAKNHWQ